MDFQCSSMEYLEQLRVKYSVYWVLDTDTMDIFSEKQGTTLAYKMHMIEVSLPLIENFCRIKNTNSV